MAKRPAAPAPESLKETSATLKETSAPVDLTLDRLKPDPENRRKHNERSLTAIEASFRDIGAARSIVIDEDDRILAGNGVQAGAGRAGITKVRVIETDGDEVIAVRRRGLSDEQKRRLALYDNRTGELSEWNADQLAADAKAGLDLRPFWTPEEEAALLSNGAADAVLEMAGGTREVAFNARQPGADNHQTFTCPLTVEQERIVRGAIRKAREVYALQTTGAALTRLLGDWLEGLNVGVSQEG